MSIRTVNLFPSDVLGVLHCAAVKDIRKYLQSVFVEIDAAGTAILVATDGHVLGAVRMPKATEPGPAFSVLVPAEVITQTVSARTRALRLVVEIAETLDDKGRPTVAKTHTLVADGAPRVFEAINFPFLDWRRVVPKTVSGEAAQFDPENLNLFVKAAKVFARRNEKYSGNAGIALGLNGTSGALVLIACAPRFVGVAMPWNVSKVVAPDWISPPAKKVAAVPAQEVTQ